MCRKCEEWIGIFASHVNRLWTIGSEITKKKYEQITERIKQLWTQRAHPVRSYTEVNVLARSIEVILRSRILHGNKTNPKMPIPIQCALKQFIWVRVSWCWWWWLGDAVTNSTNSFIFFLVWVLCKFQCSSVICSSGFFFSFDIQSDSSDGW